MAIQIRVLVVDDDPEQAEMIKDFLSLSGPFEVTWSESISSLWQHLETESFDLILLDYRLPDGTGIGALEEMSQRGYQIPVVLITGQGDERLAVQAIQLGAMDYLAKGSSYLPTLPALIQKAIRTYNLQLQMQQTLEENRYQALLLNNVRDAVVVWDTDGKITYWNPAAEALLNRSAAMQLGERVQEHYLDVFSPSVSASPDVRCLGREIERYFIRDGQTFWVSSRITSLRDLHDGEKLWGYMDVARDITSRKRAESALRSERNFISAVLDTVDALVVILDMQGKIVRMNRSCEKTTGRRLDEVKGKPVWEIFVAPEDVGRDIEAFQKNKFGKLPYEIENHWLTKDGARRLIAWSNTALIDQKSPINYVIATGIDITERRQAETALHESEVRLAQSSRLAAVGELAAGVAHHINNPLTTIIGESQLLLQNLLADHKARESAEAIEWAGWRVQKAVQQLLDFSKPAADTLENLDINETILRACDLVGEYIQSNGISFNIELTKGLPVIQGNHHQLVELWLNLLLLARDGSLDGNLHTICLQSKRKSDGKIVVEINDDGKIISAEDLAILFEPNFIRPVGGRGNGIELNICQEIVRQHRGIISAESGLPKGTTFCVIFPAEV